MKNTYRIPTMENIKAQYEEIIGYMSQLKTKKDILNFQKEHHVTMEINYEECELYDGKIPIEVIRCESWGDLDYIYFPVDKESFYGSVLKEPNFDIWCDLLELDFVECTTIENLEVNYEEGIKYILAHDLSKAELFEVIKVLREQLIDYSEIIDKYGIDSMIVEEYEDSMIEKEYEKEQNLLGGKNMRYTDIELNEFMLDEDNSGSFIIPDTDELVEMLDNIRKEKGYTDMVNNLENEVWYNFYLFFDISKKELSLAGTCNNSEHDDWEEYQLPISKDEKTMLLWKILEQFVKQI